jgi:Pyruvate/2-oxoacid:ferredoxin oxidoreductase gamma subunit
MEEPEVPIDEVREHIDHHAEHAKDTFVSNVAVSTALIAAFAAICSLLAGDHANEAMLSQIESSDQWSYYQAKSIKAAITGTKIALYEAQGRQPDAKDVKELEKYRGEEEKIKVDAQTAGKESKEHMDRHKLLAKGVTLLQIAIAVGAISALTRRRAIWVVSLVFGLVGVSFLVRELFFFAHSG